jgi:outer membrane protein OmpA-like peptidoglycan-associated protein
MVTISYNHYVRTDKTALVGHSDNTGQRAANIVLGQQRADFAKSYLMRNGIPENKIIATSKGPDEPVASNATEEGKAQNRRTVITLN